MAWTVVIAGGGFGGLYAARRLERRLPRHSARILLVADANYMPDPAGSYYVEGHLRDAGEHEASEA